MTNENTKLQVVNADQAEEIEKVEEAGADDDPTEKPLGFSPLERLPVDLMPDALCSKADRQGIKLTAAEIYEQAQAGSSPNAVKRMLSRMIATSRKELAFVESMRTFAITEMVGGKPSLVEWVRLFEQLAEKEHKRLLASIDTLARLQTPPAVNIRARQAAVMINQRSDSGGGET